MQSGTEQSWQQAEPTQQVSLNIICDCIKEQETPLCEQQTVQLVKETDTKSPSEQTLALQRLQKINRDLRFELEAQKRSQEEAKEAELRRRVDLLAQQAQLLVTGDATALAQAHLEQDRRQFQDQRMEWEHCVASLKSQLAISEEQRKDTESHLAQLQQELQSLQNLQKEAEGLQKHLQELTSQIRANEEAEAQKEARLQKHLALLQASQERERRSLAASLAQAEQHSQDLQERLDRAEQQVESLNKTQTWTREIEEAQRELQEELARTVSAVQQLQDERNQLDQRCQELQNQLSEADKEVSRLQGRLKTDETHYYNLEHSYERVCEELQVALGKVQQREADIQDIREGYERLLDRKEQELSEVLLKMEVLGNSLEETEVKLNEVLNKQQTSEPKEIGGVLQEHTRTRSRSIDSLYQFAPGDDPERFISVIQFLETKLYVTEEKLRDLTQRLEERQSHISCQDPHLCSQLTESRATAQHLSLLLHSHAKQSQRFAQETESRCRMLVGRFQVALNIVQACRERLHATPVDIPNFERQLATVAACLRHGEKDAERQKNESYNAIKVEGKVLKLTNTQPPAGDMETCLKRELFIVEKMVSVLQSQDALSRLSSVRRHGSEDVTPRYKYLIFQRETLKTDDRDESLESLICRVCAEAELIHSALKLQTQEVQLRRADLADISHPELAPYEEEEEEVQADGTGSEGAGPDVKKVETEKEPEWLQRLLSRLQRRATFLRQLCQEISGDNSEGCRNHGEDPALDLNYMQEQAKLVYLSDRLYLDLEEEFQQNKEAALSKEPDSDEQEALCELQKDNSMLREELERTEQKIISVETVNQRLLEDIQKIEDYHDEQTQKLETEFQEKIRKLQQIHEEEMKHLHAFYSKEKQTKQTCTEAPSVSDMYSLSDHTVTERKTKEDFRTRTAGGDAATMREAYQKDLEKMKACCDEEFSAMEEKHRRLIEDLQQQHQKEMSELLKEKNQLLQEETAATMAAIVAMRRAHKQELEKSKQSQSIRERADLTELHTEYEKEIQLLHKELEVLSLQHTEKCLENTQLLQELQDERKTMMQCHKENQELKKKQREADETSRLHFSVNGNQSQAAAHVSDFYEMEVILRAREAEMQFLRREARSLREELKIARMDKIYTQNKLKTLYITSQDGPHQHVGKPDEDLMRFDTWSSSRDAAGQKLKDSVANTSSAAFLKKAEKSSLVRQIRGVRSKSLKEGLSVQERMKLFESF
ncbi:trichohyalin [Parambassis ranga]|uniref:Trichohyalin n=1 Tax=Parambassis ranga TaxID=210632 RepID=A0A6P7IRT4_9TELE|nr:trichohyalin-like [Parambassis ranga]